MKDKDKTNDEVKEQKENEPQEAKEPASVEPETSVSSDAEAEEKAILEDVEELQKKLEESTAKSEEYLDRLRRTMAEFDNFASGRRRRKSRSLTEAQRMYWSKYFRLSIILSER